MNWSSEILIWYKMSYYLHISKTNSESGVLLRVGLIQTKSDSSRFTHSVIQNRKSMKNRFSTFSISPYFHKTGFRFSRIWLKFKTGFYLIHICMYGKVVIKKKESRTNFLLKLLVPIALFNSSAHAYL